jgi:predicted small secreted protein
LRVVPVIDLLGNAKRRWKMVRKLALFAFTAALLIGASAGLTACNTFEGAGQDMQAGGRAVERTADRAR